MRTNWIESEFALINGAPTFLTLADSHHRPHEVTPRLPSAWTRSTTALPPIAGEAHAFPRDELTTCWSTHPSCSEVRRYDFELEGRMHRLVNEGEAGVFDGARAARLRVDCPRASSLLGNRSVPQLRLLESDHGIRWRSRALRFRRAHDEQMGDSHAEGTSGGSSSRVMNCFTSGTASACAPSPSVHSTTSAKRTREVCGSSKGSRTTTAICFCIERAADARRVPRVALQQDRRCRQRPDARCIRS